MKFTAVCRSRVGPERRACGTLIEWDGRIEDRPPCPRCRHREQPHHTVDRQIERQYQSQATPPLPFGSGGKGDHDR